MKPTLADHRSPPDAATVVFEPTARSDAGAIGSASRLVLLMPVPSEPPAGALAESPSGRSAGLNAVRWAVSM